jgi:TPR repeat protein
MAALSEGHVIAPGSWAIALNALPNLKILLPAGVTGSADLVVSLVGLDGTVLAEAKSTLVVRSVGASAPRTVPERREPSLTPQDRQRALGFVKRGEDLMASGNVEAARLFYERAADAGLAQGALALAATFDPEELARRQVVGGLRPDPAAAKRWYERARELGADEADEPLRRLSARQP